MTTETHDRTGYSAGTAVGAIVADDYRTAQVFGKYGIDFCCGGKVPLGTVCGEKGLEADTLLEEIEALKRSPLERSHNYSAWALPFLADYIVNTHHGYLNENTPQIAAYTDKIAAVHGSRHPELLEIAAIFATIASDMAAHLREEEEVLFPAIKRIDAARQRGATPESADTDAIRASLAKLDREHQQIGDAVHAIRHLTNEYTLPADACTTYTVAFRMLKEFEDDLHTHVHLENNILFPKAASM